MTTLIYRVNEAGTLERWEPRIHPEPWLLERSRLARRRLARRGHRGRRGAVSISAYSVEPAERLRSEYRLVRRGQTFPLRTSEIPTARAAMLDVAILRGHEFQLWIETRRRCVPWCSEECARLRQHIERLTLILYCEGDPAPYAKEASRILREHALPLTL